MSRQSARDRALELTKQAFTLGQLNPGSDYETLVLMLIDSARTSVAVLGQEFLGRWAAAHAVMALTEAMSSPLILDTRIDRDLIDAWCTEQSLAIGFDPLTGEFL